MYLPALFCYSDTSLASRHSFGRFQILMDLALEEEIRIYLSGRYFS